MPSQPAHPEHSALTRLTAVAALVAAGTFTLAACAGGSTSAPSATPTTASSAASTSAEPSTAGAGAATGVARDAVATETGVAYASTSPVQTLDLYLPASDGTPAPVVVLIHGGAFAMGDSGMEAQLAQTLVQQGFAVAAVNYRLSGEALYPAGAQDVKAAVRWLRANAAQYGLDPDRFAAWGQSAGGWMATMLGVTGDQATIFDDDSLGNAEQSDAVQAVVSWFGPVDFATMDEQAAAVTACGGQSQVHGTADSPESQWLGEAVDSSDQTASTDLTSYLGSQTTVPAFFLAHGDADCNVPAGQSQQLKDALDAADATSTLTILPGAGHADPAFDQTQTEPTIAFLKEQLGA
ncbi:MAG TPA: alpha/beta hydrolase [Candidatus Nanopelagicales bacterium]